MIYLKLYTKDSDYQDVVSNDQLLLPNVSHTIDADEVYYNPVQGSNEIWYTSVNGGEVYVNPDSFSGTTGELLTVQSHFYADGVGRIIFNDDVVSIGENAFSSNGGMIPQSLEDETTPVIAKVAAYSSRYGNYDDLLSVTFPIGLKDLKDKALNGLFYLKEINIPETVSSIAENVMPRTTAIKINVASGNTAYSSEGNCLTRLSDGFLLKGTNTTIIPDNVTSIGDSAFYGCSDLTNINIPDNVISIGDSAFYGCSDLTSVELGSGVTSIGNSAFNGCTILTSIEIPNSVTSIENYTFSNCSSLTSIEIPDSVTSIGDSVFYYCTNLTSVKLGSGVTSIGAKAFYYCTNLTSVKLGSSVTSIGHSAFYGCGFTSINIPDSITSINDSAFNGCGLTSINIPDSVTSIGDSAFYYCTNLTSVKLGSGVTSIGAKAFDYCNHLTSINIPDNVTSIGHSAFYLCIMLTSVELGSGVTSIGYSAFNSCTSLTSITMKPTTPPKIDYSVFYNINSSAKIYVPSESVETYKKATNWSNYASKIQAIPSE